MATRLRIAAVASLAPLHGRLLALLLGAALASCAAPGADVHLAPLWSRTTPASGATEVDALGGVYVSEQRSLSERAQHGPGTRARAVRPLIGWREFEPGVERWDWIPPIGWQKRLHDYRSSLFFPLYYWRSYPPPEGVEGGRAIDWISLPIVIWQRRHDGSHNWGWFPIYGNLEPFLVYDRFTFFLFPLWLNTELGGTTYWNVVWPIFAWSTGSDDVHWRVWPLIGTDQEVDTHERWFFLWPIGHLHRDHLALPEERREFKWMVFPLIGRTARGTYRSWSFLWPFFGVAWDSETGFRAVDAPWPIVRVQRGGLLPDAEERTRFWPFFGHTVGQGLHQDTYAWPILIRREERTAYYDRASFYALPFWRQYDLEWRDGRDGEGRRKLWPLWHTDRIGDWNRSAVLSLSPFRRLYPIEFYWAWTWELWTWTRDGERTRSRSWLGLFKHEGDGYERRDSLAGLWSRRAYGEAGSRVRETSLLFGLVRWRSGPETTDPGWLAPAFPGPGWPAEWESQRAGAAP